MPRELIDGSRKKSLNHASEHRIHPTQGAMRQKLLRRARRRSLWTAGDEEVQSPVCVCVCVCV